MTKTSAAKNKVKVATALALLPTTNKKAKPNGKGRKGASSSPPPSKRSRSSKKQDDIPHRMIILMIRWNRRDDYCGATEHGTWSLLAGEYIAFYCCTRTVARASGAASREHQRMIMDNDRSSSSSSMVRSGSSVFSYRVDERSVVMKECRDCKEGLINKCPYLHTIYTILLHISSLLSLVYI
jgi:hypothetical protein